MGLDVHLAARVMSVGHGGQVLLSGATRELVEVDARNLGEHRLKDFEEAVAIFQLGPGAFPVEDELEHEPPAPGVDFVGREREVSEVDELLLAGSRLVTLTGPGGSGKTRLAIEAAAELVGGFRDGVFWVGLAALRDTALVLRDGRTDARGKGRSRRTHRREGDAGRSRQPGADRSRRRPSWPISWSAAPISPLLVTSRELLRVRGEVEYGVMPLAEPEAVTLFCERAGVVPSPAVDELCRQLDNLPLALELAAARARVLTPQQILERLAQRLDLFTGGRDADPRQLTLRATIEWSYELLLRE